LSEPNASKVPKNTESATMTNTRVRDGSPPDLDVVEPLWKALQGHYEKVGASLANVAHFRDLHDSWSKRRREYEQYLSEPDTILLLADVGKSTVGYAMVRSRQTGPTLALPDTVPHIESLSVLPQYRGQGSGTALLHEVIERLRSRAAAS
jgi:ribosomal protein S18 acetylase RimI-like enzyme